MAMSYNGWPASRYPSSIGVVHFEPIPGYDFPGGIKGGDVKVVFTYLVQQLHKRVEPIVIYPPGDEWGYNYRPNVNNPYQLSNHASATAIDYNATEHPNQVDYTWTRAQSLEIHKIIDDELDGVIKWLEGWDEMHFEIRGTASQVKAVADKIRSGQIPPGPHPTPVPPQPVFIGGPMYRLIWFKTPDHPAALYRCLCFYAETTKTWVPVEAWWIDGSTEKEAWKKIGLREINTRETSQFPRPSTIFHGGTYSD